MEYTQWDMKKVIIGVLLVLILVVMEYTQWDTVMQIANNFSDVLILVVMEYTQWALQPTLEDVKL